MMAGVRHRPRLPPADPHAPARRVAELVRETSLSAIARQAFLLQMSRLPHGHTQPHHVSLACEALAPLAAADRGQLFRLANHDIVAIWRGDATVALRDSIAAIRHLFADDRATVPDPDALFAVLALPRDGATLLAAVEASIRPAHPAPGRAPPPALPLDITSLAALETSLAQASMDRFARRRPICALHGDQFELAWEHRFLSIDELFETLLPDRSPTADPWLFRRLTRTLDRRLLALFTADDALRHAGAFSVDLNITSILAAEFLRFDAALTADLRGRIVINLTPEDIMADPASFLFARDFAQARGYRLLLHRIVAHHLHLLPWEGLGLDLVELPPDISAHPTAKLPHPAHIVIGGTDSPDILDWGRDHGVTLYKGLLAAPRSPLGDASRTP